jgi:hypothetical protein
METKSKSEYELKHVKRLSYLVLGMFFSFSFNNFTPVNPSMILFIVSLIMFGGLVVMSAYAKAFMEIRILFLGASITSVLFAFHTFYFSIALNGLIQIPLDALVGLFRSILLTSFFSLLERLTRFIEDQLEIKKSN